MDGGSAVSSRERPGVADNVWKVDSEWTNVAGAPPSTVDPRGLQKEDPRQGDLRKRKSYGAVVGAE